MKSVAAWVLAVLLGLGLGSLPFLHFSIGHVGHAHSAARTHSAAHAH